MKEKQNANYYSIHELHFVIRVSAPQGQMTVFDEQVSGGLKKMAGGQLSGGQMSIIQCIYAVSMRLDKSWGVWSGCRI